MDKADKTLIGEMLIHTPDKVEKLLRILLLKGILNQDDIKEIYDW